MGEDKIAFFCIFKVIVSFFATLSLMKIRCPVPSCRSPSFHKDGCFFRHDDSKFIQRYRCNKCKKCFSAATFQPTYKQKKRRINFQLLKLLCSGVSMRGAGRILNIHYITVARKLKFLAKRSRKSHEKFLKNFPKVKIIQFDDVITSEHTKCKPLAITLAVKEGSREILGTQVSSMPAMGHLSKIALKKYGSRKDTRVQGIRKLFKTLQGVTDVNLEMMSDEHPFYPMQVRRFFPKAIHKCYKGRKACIAGQGELKKGGYDPLFSLNHTAAMLRANINRLFRKTWCTTKKIQALEDHLMIYTYYHNHVLL